MSSSRRSRRASASAATVKLQRDRAHFGIRKVEHTKHCRTVVASVVDVAYRTALYRKLSDKQVVTTQLWCEWLQSAFNKHDTDEVEVALSPRMARELAKEQQCHTDIAHIYRALIECMDICAPANCTLINATELDNYLNADGVRTNSAEADDNCNGEYMGCIIEEVIAVSEGPDPRHQRLFPEVPITIALMGKPFVGKSTQSQQIADEYALQIIEPARVIKQAMAAVADLDVDAGAASVDEAALSEQQRIGLALQSSLREGKEVADYELYIAAIFDAITSAKGDTETNCWILDGFPTRCSQAELLKAKLTGFVDLDAPAAQEPKAFDI